MWEFTSPFTLESPGNIENLILFPTLQHWENVVNGAIKKLRVTQNSSNLEMKRWRTNLFSEIQIES